MCKARDFSSLHQTKLSPKLQTGLLASIQDSVELEKQKKTFVIDSIFAWGYERIFCHQQEILIVARIKLCSFIFQNKVYTSNFSLLLMKI